jgi:GAF domain-containing protein
MSLATLHEVLRAVADEGDPRRLWEALAQGSCALLGAPVALAVAPSGTARARAGEDLSVEALAGWPEAPHAIPPAAVRALAENRCIVEDDARLADATGETLRSLMAVPLAREGRVLGALLVAHTRRFAADEQHLFELLAIHGALALVHAQSTALAARRLARVEEHAAAWQRLGDPDSVDLVVDRALDVATTLLAADRAAIYLFDQGENIYVAYGRRLSRRYLEAISHSYKQSAGGLLVRTGSPLYIADIASDPRTRVVHEAAREEGLHSGLLVPLLAENRMFGGVGLYHDLPWTWDPSDLTLVRAFADQLVTTIANADCREQGERRRQHLAIVGGLARALARVARGLPRLQNGLAGMVAEGVPSAWLFAAPDAHSGGRPVRRAHAGASALDIRVPEETALAALAAGQVVRHGLPSGDALVAAPLPGDPPAAVLVIKPPRPRAVEPRPGTSVLQLQPRPLSPEVDDLVTTCAAQLYTAE